MHRNFRYYDLILGAFVAVLLCSNLIGPAKVVQVDFPFLGPTDFGAGNIFFPLSYLFGDILTEVYGYALARRVIWAGFAAMLFATVMTWVVLALPASPNEPFSAQLQPALVTCFGGGWRIALGSIVAFFVGDFLNSYVLAKLKVRTQGRHLWLRFISSTFVGQGVDSLIFYAPRRHARELDVQGARRGDHDALHLLGLRQAEEGRRRRHLRHPHGFHSFQPQALIAPPRLGAHFAP